MNINMKWLFQRIVLPTLAIGALFVLFGEERSLSSYVSSARGYSTMYDPEHRFLRSESLSPQSFLHNTPKIVHFTVADSAPTHQMKVIEYSTKNLESFGFEVMIHRDSDAEKLIYSQYHNLVPAWELVKNTEGVTKGARIGDFLRLLLIYHYGGIYLDSDMVACKDLSPLLGDQGVATFPIINSGRGDVVNAAFAGPPHHIVFRMALERMGKNKDLATEDIKYSTGVKFLGEIVDEYFERTQTPPIVRFSDGVQLPEPEEGSIWLQSGLIRLGAAESTGRHRTRGLGTLGHLGLIHFNFGSWKDKGRRIEHRESRCDKEFDLIKPFLDSACAISFENYNRKWSDCGEEVA